jgi:hypothetical protein
MERNEYPKMLYGPKGWADLNDCQMVQDADEEKRARKKGYADLGPLDETVAQVEATAEAA